MKALKSLIQSIEYAINNPAPDGDGAESASTLLGYLERAQPYLQDQVWQPMETVPMDGTPILVSVEGRPGREPGIYAAEFRPNVKLIGGHSHFDMNKPLAWMPAPEPLQ